jgi:hypothetical protein
MKVRNVAALSVVLLGGALLLKPEAKAQNIDSGNVQINTLTNVTPNVAAAENDTYSNLFLEKSNHALSANLAVDVLNPSGSYDANDLSVGNILAGTRVNSYWLNADKVGSSSTWVDYSGQITFENKILGVIFNNQTRFANSTTELGRVGTTYPGSGFYGPLDIHDSTRDTFSITNGGRTLKFNWTLNTHADQMRIITAVPEPAFYQLGFLLAGGALILLRRRRA